MCSLRMHQLEGRIVGPVGRCRVWGTSPLLLPLGVFSRGCGNRMSFLFFNNVDELLWFVKRSISVRVSPSLFADARRRRACVPFLSL